MCNRRPARESTGRVAVSPSGWWTAWPTTGRLHLRLPAWQSRRAGGQHALETIEHPNWRCRNGPSGAPRTTGLTHLSPRSVRERDDLARAVVGEDQLVEKVAPQQAVGRLAE